MTEVESECRAEWFKAEVLWFFADWYAERLLRQIWGICGDADLR